jgi:myo-inositol-1-phosphate synthase
MERAMVLDPDLQHQIYEEFAQIKPLPSIYYPDFIAQNQSSRADNILHANAACTDHVNQIRHDIAEFRRANNLEKIIVIWNANMERLCEETRGIHDSADNLLKC